MSNKYKKYWLKARPSLKVFGSVTWYLAKLGLILAIIALLGGAGAGTGMAIGALKDLPPFNPSLLERPSLPSYIYDKHGDLITEIHDAQNRIPVKMADLPIYLRNAFLAAEDNNFFEHPGIDLKGLVRALYTNLTTGDSQGASTISQQVIKQVFLTSEKTISRKVQELYLAVNMEGQFTKEEIFEFYINNATFYDNNAWGIEAAAQTYFDKSVGELTLSEAALLAGIPNYPGYYSPHPDNMEPAIKRRNDVLARMLRFGYITETEYEEAKAEEILLNIKEHTGWPYPHYIDAVVFTYAIDALMESGLYDTEADAAQAIRRDGLKIYTAMDPRVQKLTEEVMFSDEYYPKDSYVYPEGHPREGRRYPQGAAMVMEAETGMVLAAVGGREYNATNRINRIFRGFQPGSSIKPVMVYGPAFEYGILSPGDVLDDAPTVWPDIANEWYAPENFAKSFRGMVTVRDAIIVSDNIPAMKAFEMVGKQVSPRATTDFASSLGLDIPENSYSMLTSAIGGSNYLVSPLQMTKAFSAFANRGKVSDPIFVTKITDRNGVEIFTAVPHGEIVMEEETAFLVTSVMRDVVANPRGTARPSGLTRLTVAAKTGTTDDAHDRWTVGYSRDYVFTVWMGNDNKQVMVDEEKVFVPGLTSNTAYVRLNKMFGAIAKGTIDNNDKPFHPAPNGVTRVTVCKKSGKLPGDLCPSSDLTTDWFVRGTEPTETCALHVSLEICQDSGLLATEYCPRESVAEQMFFDRPEFILTDERWRNGKIGRGPADADNMSPREYCDKHGPAPVTHVLNITPFQTGMRLEWDISGENFGFVVYRQDFDKNEFIRLTPEPTYDNYYMDVFQALPGLDYKYKVMSLNASGFEESRHNQKNARQPLELDLEGNLENHTVRLDWKNLIIVIPGGKVEGYNVYRDGGKVANRTQSDFIDTEIEPGKTYQYAVSVIYKIKGEIYESAKTTAITVNSGPIEEPEDPGDGEPGDEEPGDGEPGGDEPGDGEGDQGFLRWFKWITFA